MVTIGFGQKKGRVFTRNKRQPRLSAAHDVEKLIRAAPQLHRIFEYFDKMIMKHILLDLVNFQKQSRQIDIEWSVENPQKSIQEAANT